MRNRSLALLTGTMLFVSQLAGAYQIPAEATFNNGQIIRILMMAYQHEVKTADLVPTRSSNAGVKKFAEVLHKHHSKDITELNAMLIQEKMELEESEVAAQLEAQLNSAHSRLEKLSGSEFDRAFLNHQIMTNENGIEMLSSVAIPQTTNAVLKAKLQGDWPLLRGHLLLAKALKAKMGH